MKLTTRDKVLLQVLSLLGVSAMTVLTMMHPDVLGNTHSIVGINDKKTTLESLNGELQQNEQNIFQQGEAIQQLENQLPQLQEEAQRLREQLNQTETEFHTPSILIFIEQLTNKHKLDLVVAYDQIQSNAQDASAGATMPEQPPEEAMGEEAMEENAPRPEDQPEKTADTEEVGQEDLSQPALQATVPSIEGVDVTTIPVSVEGTYADIRAFLSDVDTVDFIETNAIHLQSEGASLKGQLIFNVFHTPNGGENY